MKSEVLKVSNIEKYYGNKSNITKAINILMRYQEDKSK